MSKIYCVKDNRGRFEGNINIYPTSFSKSNPNWQWYYYSQKYPMSGNLFREGAELKIEKLREINALSGYDLNWEVVEFTDQEYRGVRHKQSREYEENGLDPLLSGYWNSKIEYKDVAKGCITKHRKLVKEIGKTYKLPNRAVVA